MSGYKTHIAIALIVFVFVMLSAIGASAKAYVTETGDKFHCYGCRYLTDSCIETTVGTALLEGKKGCSVCFK
jgi:hypothetical protein